MWRIGISWVEPRHQVCSALRKLTHVENGIMMTVMGGKSGERLASGSGGDRPGQSQQISYEQMKKDYEDSFRIGKSKSDSSDTSPERRRTPEVDRRSLRSGVDEAGGVASLHREKARAVPAFPKENPAWKPNGVRILAVAEPPLLNRRKHRALLLRSLQVRSSRENLYPVRIHVMFSENLLRAQVADSSAGTFCGWALLSSCDAFRGEMCGCRR